ncbi:hypothetical protein [Microbacterium sp. A94]|uniref:hypothetical protein n=1 Tax=Microbacterium sp. A94 TaxID=3450717 RepID=UPI003F42B922
MADKISDFMQDGDGIALRLNDGTTPFKAVVRFVDFAGVMTYAGVNGESPFVFYPWSAIDFLTVSK